MILLRLLNPQGIVGLAVSLCLGLLLTLQKGETRHWRKQSRQFEQIYRAEQAHFAATVADYRAAADRARAADRSNANRVAAEQRAINERTTNELEARLAAARHAADRLHRKGAGSGHPGSRGSAPVPGLPVAAGNPPQAAGEDGLPDALVATEQAIQLDELIKWVRRQSEVDPNSEPRSP